jgi:FixJ family two-component response regulator
LDVDIHFRRQMARLLNAFGHLVESFGSLDEYLDAPALLDTACLISAVNVATSTGLGLNEALETLDLRIPTIFVSELRFASGVAPARLGNALGHLEKPIAPGKLLRLIRSVTPANKAPRMEPHDPEERPISEMRDAA